ncbi:MAG: hypothetical protein KBC35_04190 [Candidatus Pacebacteria bacterium]|nr:hypothetical protein [Candidatus Paceibacterota bacterium]
MSLYEALQKANSEEDVKDIYIKALGLKAYQKGLIDIQTKEIWFEAKDKSNNTTYKMFTQLLYYVQEWMKHGEEVPPFLCVIDTEKAAIMKTENALPLFERKDIKWGKSASDVTPEALDAVSAYIGTHFVSYRIKTHEQEFIDAVKAAIKTGDIVRTEIKPANIKSVFDKWVDMIGKEINGVTPDKYELLFFADIMHDGTVSAVKDLPAELLYKDGQPVFFLDGKIYELGSKEGYRQFWAIYHKPPREEHRKSMLERRDTLIPLDERSFKGAYYTPLHVVDKAYEKLTETLGDNWQNEYIVWDMCCGVGNLEVKHSNHRNLYMSTLDQADVDVMKATKTCAAAERFQYDYLNDDITDGGQIDYSLTNKVPESLRRAIKSGKKILVLINPPYAESGEGAGAGNKKNVAKTKFASVAMSGYGKSTNELFTQFIVRIAKEIPHATLAMFSKLKYVNASNFEAFRKQWDADYLGGFIVPSKSFEGLKGSFPIGFLLWQTSHGDNNLSQISDITVDVLDKDAQPIGEKKFYNLPTSAFLSQWIDRPEINSVPAIALKNTLTPSTSKISPPTWSDGAIGHMLCDSNDLQHAGKTALFSGVYRAGHDGTFFVNQNNLWQAAIVFTVRRIIKPTWQNDRDQFLQPIGELTEEFKNDCLVWMLFNGSNLTASANDLEWNDKKWSIVNHFIPFTEDEVGAPERFESDFMVRYMAGKEFSLGAQEVLARGRELWSEYYKHTDPHTVREELKLNRVDVGWYQVRKALEARNKSGDYATVSFDESKSAYQTLTDKLRPQVYTLGFLKE